MTEWQGMLEAELERVWDDISDVSDAERELAKAVAKDAAELGAKALLGQAEELEAELEIVKATAAELSAIAALRAERAARLAAGRVIENVLRMGLKLLA